MGDYSNLTSYMDPTLDSMTYNPGNRDVDLIQLGSNSQQWLNEYYQLAQQFPGFVGFIIKRIGLTGSDTAKQLLERVPFLVYKQRYESYVKSGQLVIADVWRDYFANEDDQITVAMGMLSYMDSGGIESNKNLMLSGIPRMFIKKRRK